VGYLLDTNIVSDLVRHPQGRVAQRIRDVGEGQVCTSIIVAAELRYGATPLDDARGALSGSRRAKKGSVTLAAQADTVLTALEVLPLEAPADAVYGRLRTGLEQRGQPIGANDLLIAAQAMALGHVLVTDNEREFERIDDLRCENWLRGG
jgi:tRNA(fMet)-specific endonuclease VapC